MGKILAKLPSWVSHVYSLFIIVLGWVLFYFEDMGALFAYLGNMFSLSNGLIGSSALYYTLAYLPLLIAAAVASTPLMTNIYNKLKEKRLMWLVETVLCAVVLFVCTASLVNQSYNPFLYFRF